MKDYDSKLLKKIRHFFSQKKAVVAIEMAFILPIFMLLTMGIMEYAIIFSIRTGIEESARQMSRIRLSTDGTVADHTTSTNINSDYLVELHELLSRVVGINNMAKTVVCSKFGANPNALITASYVVSQCLQFKNTPPSFTGPSADTPIGLGPSNSYVALRITYAHQYLTPLGALITGLGSNIQMTSFIYYKRED